MRLLLLAATLPMALIAPSIQMYPRLVREIIQRGAKLHGLSDFPPMLPGISLRFTR